MNLDKLIRDNIKRMQPYSSARDEFKGLSKDYIFLDANENPNPSIINRYPDPKQLKLKEVLGQQKGVQVENIILGNGSDEILDLIFRAFCEPGIDAVISLPPTYGMYNVLANTNDIEIKEVPLESNFQPNVSEILKLNAANTKLLFLCSPNNPSGNCFETSRVEELLKRFNGIVVLDEAYIDFTLDKIWLSRLNDYPNLIITQTLSKAYGMAGIRLGIAYASKEIISILNRIKPPYNVNQLTQEKAIEVLNQKDVFDKQLKTLLSERLILIKELGNISYVKKVYPSDANFLLVKVDNATKRYNQLIENGIVVRNRTKQFLCENCLRITIGTPNENKILINTLKEL
ncbi:histidinol-phosphate transaminase [Pseudofulvibacter geojedonensis]|uniref:Histidinol-phosphate aminotransferase n=1 Tax=Pseudofulvibacter geojedonensis TaxID=1123758 RepID=A0ABW3I2T9_9FLAO